MICPAVLRVPPLTILKCKLLRSVNVGSVKDRETTCKIEVAAELNETARTRSICVDQKLKVRSRRIVVPGDLDRIFLARNGRQKERGRLPGHLGI